MLLNMKHLFIALICAVCVNQAAALAAEPGAPAESGGQMVYFDAARDGAAAFENRNADWESGNCLPATEAVARGGRAFVKFSYEGDSGLGRSLLKLTPTNAAAAGVVLTIDYPLEEFGSLDVSLHDNGGNTLVRRLTLRPGLHDYPVDGGFASRSNPGVFDWQNLRSIGILFRPALAPAGCNFFLEKIRALPPAQPSERMPLPIVRIRKVQEVPLANAGAAALAGIAGWRSGIATTPAPFSATIAYDASNLYIATVSEFPTPPIAAVAQRDGQVWQDESVEYFFCHPNDNRSVIQLAVNASNVAFDYKTTLVAGKLRKDIAFDLPFQRDNQYHGGFFHSKITLAFADLGCDPARDRAIGFQLAQNYYQDRGDPRLASQCWAPTDLFPRAPNFGLLVFNHAPFGAGEITIKSFDKIKLNVDRVRFEVGALLAEFDPGEYQATGRLIMPDGSAADQARTLRLDRGPQALEFQFDNLAESTGIYSFFLALTNRAGNVKVFAANAVNSPEPPDRFGELLLCPAPKFMALQPGEFHAAGQTVIWLPDNASDRIRLTAELFKQKYFLHTGINLETRTTSDLPGAAGIVFRIAAAADIGGKTADLKPEGYALKADAGRVEITGADEPGLFYGGLTFLQLLHHSIAFRGRQAAPAVEILDWPDMPNRMVKLAHAQRLTPSPFQEVRSIEYLMDWTDRMVAENKYNTLFLDVSGAVRFERRPEFNGPEKIYTLDDIRRLAQFCRERFISLNPFMEGGGHADWWLLAYHPELRETGYKIQANVTDPRHDAIYRDCMLDLIEAMSAKMASPYGDEWWQKMRPGETPAPLLAGKTRAEVFRDFQVGLHGWLAERGVRMTLFEDMLSPFHNGKYHGTYKIAADLPRDIIITWWKGGLYLDEGLPWMLDQGFTVWCLCTGFYTLDDKFKNDPRIQGFGKTVYSFGNFLIRDSQNFYYYIPSYTLLRAADYAWNARQGNDASLEQALESGWLETVRAARAAPAQPRAGARLHPISLDGCCNADFAAEMRAFGGRPAALPRGLADVAQIPMLFEEDAANCVRLAAPAPRAIAVNGKYSALVFLHTALFNRPAIEKQKPKFPTWRDYPYGYPYGQYLVKYADGSEIVLKLRHGDNILTADMGPLFRGSLNCRYILRLTADDYSTVCLYQWEWANPFPDREILTIQPAAEGVYPEELFKTLLFAVSGREAPARQ